MNFGKQKSKSANTSPRDKERPVPKIKITGTTSGEESRSSPSSPTIICPRCKTSKDVVRLGMWKEKDVAVYFCGLFFPDERACRNVWMPEMPRIQIDEVKMRYLPGPDGDYLVTFV